MNTFNAPYRKSTRLKHYDYSQNGQYFVTICSHQKISIFGKIEEGKMFLNTFGKIAESEIMETNRMRDNIEISSFVVMPNHIHMIVEILNTKELVGRDERSVRKFSSPKNELGSVIRGYKSAVTRQCRGVLHTPDIIWQRNYHEHIIRDEKLLEIVHEYIQNNPLRWKDDMFFEC